MVSLAQYLGRTSDGRLLYGGRTREQVLAALDEPIDGWSSWGEQRWRGVLRAGLREGTWRFFVGEVLQYEVDYVADAVVTVRAFGDARPAGFAGVWAESRRVEHEFTRRRVELVLDTLASEPDIDAVAARIEAEGRNPIAVVTALRRALGISLYEARVLTGY